MKGGSGDVADDVVAVDVVVGESLLCCYAKFKTHRAVATLLQWRNAKSLRRCLLVSEVARLRRWKLDLKILKQ